MVNDVREKKCENALVRGHSFARSNSQRYNQFSGRVNDNIDQYN